MTFVYGRGRDVEVESARLAAQVDSEAGEVDNRRRAQGGEDEDARAPVGGYEAETPGGRLEVVMKGHSRSKELNLQRPFVAMERGWPE